MSRSSVFFRGLFYLAGLPVPLYGWNLSIYPCRKCKRLLKFSVKSLVIIFLYCRCDHMYGKTTKIFKFCSSLSLCPWYQKSKSVERTRLAFTYICACKHIHTPVYICTKRSRDTITVKSPQTVQKTCLAWDRIWRRKKRDIFNLGSGFWHLHKRKPVNSLLST